MKIMSISHEAVKQNLRQNRNVGYNEIIISSYARAAPGWALSVDTDVLCE